MVSHEMVERNTLLLAERLDKSSGRFHGYVILPNYFFQSAYEATANSY